MSYQIEYPVTNRLEQRYNVKSGKKPMIPVIVVICIILLAVSVYILGVDTIREFIIPGDDAVTVSAFHTMQDNLKEGMPVKDAVAAFCTEIIESANIQ